MLATDLADYLARKGVPFREAHDLVGQAVLLSEKRGVKLRELDHVDFKGISSTFGSNLFDVLDFEASVEARSVTGGTALAAVRAQLEEARAILEA